MTTHTDDFNRSNGDLGSNWTNLIQTNGEMYVESNTARFPSQANCAEAYTGGTQLGNDQSVQVKVYLVDNGYGGVIARASSTDWYDLMINKQSMEWYFDKLVSSTYTPITSGSLSSWTDGDTVKLVCVGTTISGYHNATRLFSLTDSDVTAGDAGIYGSGYVDTVIFDDFSATDEIAAARVTQQVAEVLAQRTILGAVVTQQVVEVLASTEEASANELTLSASSSAVPTIARLAHRLQSISVSSSAVASRSRTTYLMRSSSAAGQATMARATAWLRSLTASCAAVASLAKQASTAMTLSISSAASATLAKVANAARTLTASASGAASVSRAVAIVRSATSAAQASATKAVWISRAASSAAAATIERVLDIARTLSASASAAATTVKLAARLRAASSSAAATATLDKMFAYIATLSASARAWAFVGGVPMVTVELYSATNDAMGGDVASDPFDLGPGRLVVVTVFGTHEHADLDFPISVTDTAGNTYTPRDYVANNGEVWDSRVLYCYNSKPHANNVITADLGESASLYMQIVVCTGARTDQDPFVDEKLYQYSDVTLDGDLEFSTDPITLTRRGIVLLFAMAHSNDDNVVADDGWSLLGSSEENGYCAAKIATTPGTYTPTLNMRDIYDVHLVSVGFHAHPAATWEKLVSAASASAATMTHIANYLRALTVASVTKVKLEFVGAGEVLMSAVAGATAAMTKLGAFIKTLTTSVRSWSSLTGASGGFEQIAESAYSPDMSTLGPDYEVETAAFDLPPHRLVVVLARWYDNGPVQYIIDTAGNAYYPATEVRESASSGVSEQLWYCYNSKPMDGNKVAMRLENVAYMGYPSQDGQYCAALVYSGIDVSSDPLIGEEYGTGTSSAGGTTIGSLTLPHRGLIVEAASYYQPAARTWTPGAAFTERVERAQGTYQATAIADLISEDAGSWQGEYTASASINSWVIVAAAFRGTEPPALSRALTATAVAVGATLAKLRALLASITGTSAGSPTLERETTGTRVLEAAAAVSASASRAIALIREASAGVAASVVRSVTASLSAAAGAAATMLTGFAATLSAAAAASSAIVGRLGRTLAASASSSVAMSRAIALARSAASGVTGTVSRGAEAVLAASAAASGAFVRAIALSRSAVAGVAGAVSRATGRTMTAAAAVAVSLTARLGRVMSATSSASASVLRRVQAVLTATAGTAATVFQGLSQWLVAHAGAAATLVQSIASLGNLVMRYVVRPALFWRSRSVDPAVDADPQIKPAVDADRRIRDE